MSTKQLAAKPQHRRPAARKLGRVIASQRLLHRCTDGRIAAVSREIHLSHVSMPNAETATMPQLSRRTGLSLAVRGAQPRAEPLEARTLLSVSAFSANFDSAPTTLPGVTAQLSGVTTVESVQGYAGLGTGANQFAGQ